MNSGRKLRRMEQKMIAAARSRKFWQRVIGGLSCLVVFVTTYALILPAITMTADPTCGLEEHTHTDACYTDGLVCGREEGSVHEHTELCYGFRDTLQCGREETTGHAHTETCYELRPVLTCTLDEEHTEACFREEPVLACGLEEAEPHTHTEECILREVVLECPLTEEPHTHTDACSGRVLICEKQEHTHTKDCYPGEEADPDSEWIDKLPAPTGNWAADLLAAAGSQVGYAESTEDTQDGSGRTLYGDSFGSPYGKWDGAFAAWLLQKLEIPAEPGEGIAAFICRDPNTEIWRDQAAQQGLLHRESQDYRPGDLLFFFDEDGVLRVGIVVHPTDSDVRLILGDRNDQVENTALDLEKIERAGWISMTPPAPAKNQPSEEPEQKAGYSENWVEGNFDAVAFTGRDTDSRGVSIRAAMADGGSASGPLEISGNTYISTNGITVLWHEHHETGETGAMPWKPMPTDGSTIPADAHLRFQVQYANINPADVKAHGYQISFSIADTPLVGLAASGEIKVGEDVRGYIDASGDSIVLTFDSVWVDGLIEENKTISNERNKKKIFGDFYFQSELDLSKVDDEDGNKFNLGPVAFELPVDDDAVAKYGKVDFTKAAAGKILQDPDTKNYYMEYTITATAGEYGCPQVSVRDSMQDSRYIAVSASGSPYVGVGATDAPTNTPGGPTETGGTGTVRYETSTVTPAGVASAGYDLVWTLGDMAPNEIRTLTYRVQVKDDYIGYQHASGESDALVNNAQLFSKGYPKRLATEPYIPKLYVETQKSHTAPVKNEDGTYTIHYTFRIKPDASNSYTLKNVKFTDDFGDRTYDAYGAGVVNNTRYDKGSVKLRDANGNEIDYSGFHIGDDPDDDPGDNPVWRSCTKTGVNRDNHNMFDLYIGDLEPGAAYTVEYDVIFDPLSSTLATNGKIGVNNRGEIWDSNPSGPKTLGFKDNDEYRGIQVWDSKVNAGQVANQMTVPITDGSGWFIGSSTATGDPLPVDSSHGDSFTVPSGAHKYVVVVNESGSNGDWDVSNAVMTDSLSEYLQYVGYVRVDVFDTLSGLPYLKDKDYDSKLTAALQSKTAKATYWVKVDGLQSFSYTASQFSPGGKYAYVLTYYAKPSPAASSVETVVAGNVFGLSGTVVGNGKGYVLGNMTSRREVTVVGGNNYSIAKQAWYYEAPTTDTVKRFTENLSDKSLTERENLGAIYYAITVDQKIPENLQIRDTAERNSQSIGAGMPKNYPLSVYQDSLVGVYIVNLEEESGRIDSLESLDALEELVSRGLATKLEKGTDYNVTGAASNNRYCEFKFTHDIVIPSGSKAYCIVKADLTIPPLMDSVSNFRNEYRYGINNINNNNSNQVADYKLYMKNPTLVKDAGNVFRVSTTEAGKKKFEKFEGGYTNYFDISTGTGDGTRWDRELQNSLLIVTQGDLENFWDVYRTTNGNTSVLPYKLTNDQYLNYAYDDGLYVTWLISLSEGVGRFTLLDELPEGVELCYVRTYGGATSGNYPLAITKPTITTANVNIKTQVTGTNNAYDGWTAYSVGAPQAANCGESANWITTYTNYYVNGNQIAICIPNLKAETTPVFQVVCRVTDPRVYMEDVDFTNSVKLLDRAGRELRESYSTVTARSDALSKKDLSTMTGSTLSNPILPYQISINPDAMDMNPKGDVMEIPLIDFMSGNLKMDMTTLRIYKDALPASGQEDTSANLIYSGKTVHKTNDDGALLYYDADGNETTEYTNSPVMAAIGNKGDYTIRIATETTTVSGNEGTAVKFYNLPDGVRLYITYNSAATLATGGAKNSFFNDAYWEGYENIDGGHTEKRDVIFEAGASAGTSAHGALHIIKHDGMDESKHLAGAKFELYRAAYEVYSDGTPVIYEDGAALSEAAFLSRMIEKIDDLKGMGRDYAFKKDSDTGLYEYYYRNGEGTVQTFFADDTIPDGYVSTDVRAVYYTQSGVETLLNYDDYDTYVSIVREFQKTVGASYSHQVAMVDGKAILAPEKTQIDGKWYQSQKLAEGITDINGILDYGIDESEDAIHFNKIYCVKEVEAPEGYLLDSTEYFFVVPNDNSQFQDGVTNFFYRDSWPSNVYPIKTQTNGVLTYSLDVFNIQGSARVTKAFGGNGNAAKPGSYGFAIYAEVDGTTPVESSKLGSTEFITFTEADFDISVDPVTGETVYHLKDSVHKYAEFKGLAFDQPYYIFEVSGSNPIQNGKTGTVNGTMYYVTYPDGNDVTSTYTRVDGSTVVHTPEISVVNSSFVAKVTKQFADVSGDVLDKGLAGTYTFGIWRKTNVVDGVPAGHPLKTVQLTWEDGADSTANPTKTVYFTGLDPDQEYVIFEMKSSTEGAVNGEAVIVNGTAYAVSYVGSNEVSITLDGTEVPGVTVQNNSTVSLPHTGGMGTRGFALTGAALVLTALTGLTLIPRRKED